LSDDDRQHDVNLNDNLKSIQGMGCADLDDLLSKKIEKNTPSEELAQKIEFQSNSPIDIPLVEKLGDSDANVSTSHTQQGNGSAQQPTSTLSTGSSQSRLLLLQEYAQRIMAAIGFQSPAVGRAIAGDIQRSLVAKDISESELVELAGAETYQAFTTLRALTDNEVDLVEIVQKAIASNDVEIAKSVLSSLKEVCNSGAADRQKVWNSLAESERVAFKALVQ
jgi:hypothetical protein